MNDAIKFLHDLSSELYSGLNSITFPVLGVSFVAVFLTVLFINSLIWVIRVITGGKQDSGSAGKPALDNNNNYIYRRY